MKSVIARCVAWRGHSVVSAGSLAILVLFLATLSAGGMTGEVAVIDGVPHIKNGTIPSQGTETWRLEELWRVGGEDDDRIFGLITQVIGDNAGNVYLLDAQLCEVQVFSAAGEHLRTLFGQGEGPGEVRSPRDMFWAPDRRVALIEEFPGRIVMVEPDGTPAGSITVTGEGRFCSLTACFGGADLMLLSGTYHGQAENGVVPRTNFLALFGDDGKELVRLADNRTTYNFKDFVFAEREHMPNFWWSACVGPDGRIYTAPYQDRYLIEVFNSNGGLDRVIEREYRRHRRSEDEIGLYYGSIEGAMANLNIDYRIEVEDHDPDVAALQRGLRVRQDGTLWVLTSQGMRGQPAGIMATFDVFDAEGHFARQVAIACEGDGVKDGLFFLGKDRMVVVKGYIEAVAAQFGRARVVGEGEDEPAPMQAICYQVVNR